MEKNRKAPHPYVWFLLAGPIIVVVAGLVTAWIAWKWQDPVIEEDYYRKGIELSEKQNLIPLMPAQRARNHSATPTEHVPLPAPHKP